MKKEYALPRATPESVGISSEAVLGFLEAVEAWEGGEPHGLMLARYGKVFAECWWAPYTPGRPHIGWSVAKSYAGTAVGIAIAEGILSLDTRLIDIFPEYAPEEIGENLGKLRVRHMLSMTSGMREMSPEGPGWLPKFINTPVDYEPGTVFMYNSQGINALGAIIRRVTGMTMHEYLGPRLYEKLGMNAGSVFWTYIPGGYEWCAGGVFSTTEDNLRLAMLYAQGGVWNGERILTEEYVKLATSRIIGTGPCTLPFGMEDEHPESRAGYGFTIWMGTRYNSYRFYGAHGQYGIVFPDHGLVVSTHLTSVKEEKRIIELVYDHIIPHLAEKPLPENPGARAKLDRVLSTRALPRPEYGPASPMISKINGRTFEVTGDLTLLTAFEPREYKGSGIRVSDGIASFTMRFNARKCVMDYMENGRPYQAVISLDGGRAENRLEVARSAALAGGMAEVFPHTPTEVLLSGFWESGTRFVVKARWIQSSVEKTVLFDFEGDTVRTDGKLTTGLLGFYPSAPEIAVGRME